MRRSTNTAAVLTALATAFVGPAITVAEDSADQGLHPRVKIETSLGDIVLELNGEKAPITTLNFIQYATDKFYEGTIFHRVMPTFMIQGGGFTLEVDRKTDGLRAGIKNEWKNGLKNNRGTVSMARLGGQPDSATSQFFINVVDNPSLDRAQRDGAAYAVFGKVVEGIETVDKIRNTDTTTSDKFRGGPVVPVVPVVIKSVTVLGTFNRDKIQARVDAMEATEQQDEATAVADQEKALNDIIKQAETESGNKVATTESGLRYIDMKMGDGDSPAATDTVEVHYTGWLTDGTKFDSSVDRGTPSTFPLNGVIKGWTEGVGSMKVGGKRKLIIPSDLGYGKRGSPPKIPPDAMLVFDIELISIK